MSKAINWPIQYLNEVINEDSTKMKAAIRLGSIYYDHCYYVPDEVVDIRVNHKVIRQAKIQGEMKLCPLSELTETDFSALKSDLNTLQEVVEYLAKTYEEEVDGQTQVTVVYYKNLEPQKNADKADDPHM